MVTDVIEYPTLYTRKQACFPEFENLYPYLLPWFIPIEFIPENRWAFEGDYPPCFQLQIFADGRIPPSSLPFVFYTEFLKSADENLLPILQFCFMNSKRDSIVRIDLGLISPSRLWIESVRWPSLTVMLSTAYILMKGDIIQGWYHEIF